MVLMTPPTPVRTGGPYLAPDTHDDLYDLAVFILAKIQEIFAREGVDLPDRQYVTSGQPAQDCEQVTVAFQQMYIGPPGDEASAPQRCDGPRSATFQIAITRCISVGDKRGNPPTAAQLQADARRLMRDATILMNSVNELDDYLGVIVTLEATDPEGGMQSVVMSVTLGVADVPVIGVTP